jgi:hypothetical protein
MHGVGRQGGEKMMRTKEDERMSDEIGKTLATLVQKPEIIVGESESSIFAFVHLKMAYAMSDEKFMVTLSSRECARMITELGAVLAALEEARMKDVMQNNY